MNPKQLCAAISLLLGPPKTTLEGIQQVELVLQAAARLMYARGLKRQKIAAIFYECADRFAAEPPAEKERYS